MLLNIPMQIRFTPHSIPALKEIKEKKKCKTCQLEMVMVNTLPFCVLASVVFHQEQNSLGSFMKLQEENF